MQHVSIKDYEQFSKDDGIEDEIKKFTNIEKYFKEKNQSMGKLSPNSQFLFYTVTIDDITQINVLNLQSFESYTIYKQKIPKYSFITDIEWIDQDSIFFRIKTQKGPLNLIAHLGIDKSNKIISVEHLVIPSYGRLIDPIPTEENFIYFGNGSSYKSKYRGLYKVDTSTKKTIKKTLKKKYAKIKKLKDSIYWLTDHNSEVRFVITAVYSIYDSPVIEAWFLPDVNTKKWLRIKSYDSFDDIIVPKMLSRDGKSFYVLTDEFGDKKSVHEYSTADFSHKGAFYEDDDYDVEDVITDPVNGEIIGIEYVESGFYKFKYFESNKDVLKDIRAKNPNLQLFSVHQDKNTGTVLLLGINEYTKGAWYLYNINRGKIYKLFDQDAQYNTLTKGVFHTVQITSKDDLVIEEYLVVPEDASQAKKSPLIVIPHGGPIGVRDYAYNSSLQHFYASQGFATLKVNYRGSGGFGKKFKESGHRQWGEKIELDINTMVDHVLKNYPISENNICSMGSSYGGYSAIMLTILYPDRYNCAVSYAGVTDIPLIFTSSQIKNNEELLKSMKEIAGDPETDLQSMLDKSPVYLTDKVKRPILLVHGEKDKQVTIENSLRMKAIMDAAHLTSELLVLKDEGHSFEYKESKVAYIAKSLAFIKMHIFEDNQ